MSRSYKKNPYIPFACCGKGKAMKSAKKNANSIVRQYNDDLPSGRFYKKLDERYAWPDDGKQRFDDPKGYRK